MKQGKLFLLVLATTFLLTEILFIYFVAVEGNDDIFGASIKTLVFLLFILLFTKKLTWAKWTLSSLLILHGLLCLGVGLELGMIFYFIGLFDILFGILIHTSKFLRVFHKEKQEAISPPSSSNIKPTFIVDGHEFRYPLLLKRYKALFIDASLLLTVLIVIMILVEDSQLSSTIMISSSLILSFTYEPFLTAYSRTVGQKFMKIRVVRHRDPKEKISLVDAYLRCVVKGLLGWLSFITINFNTEHRAIHDIASDAVMIIDEEKKFMSR